MDAVLWEIVCRNSVKRHADEILNQCFAWGMKELSNDQLLAKLKGIFDYEAGRLTEEERLWAAREATLRRSVDNPYEEANAPKLSSSK